VWGFLRVACFVPAGILLAALPVVAQVRLGLLSSDMNGTISPGYTADYGNMTPSDHSWAIGGIANLNGSFYSPNFLSYNVGLYLNQSRANSNFQSISNASGINASSTIFGGSRFPGSINYTKAWNSEGNYDVPGIANYVTHGNNDAFGIHWGEELPGIPSLSAGFQMGNSQYSVYGTNDSGKDAFHSLNLNSSYKVAGFNMGGYYTSGGGHALIPEVVSGQQDSETQNDNDGFGFNVSHMLPLHGTVSAGVNRSGWNSEDLGYTSSGTIDLFNSLVSLHPTTKLAFSASANYSDNLSGQLIEAVVGAGSVPAAATGGAVTEPNSNETSNSLDLMGVASYAPAPNLQTSAFAERRSQSYLGESYGVDSFGANAAYSRKLLDGNFNASLNVTENTSEQTAGDILSFSTTENYSSEIMGWKVGGSFGYAQNAQTLLVTYMNSNYNYSGNLRRRWGRLNVSAGAGGSRSALTEQAGTANSSQSFSGSVGYSPWFTASGNYSKANGQALATGTGLVPVPVPSPIVPSSLVSLFGGDSYSFAISSSPARGFTVAASYAKSTSNVTSNGAASANDNEQYNALLQYQVRKLYFNSGYARLEQGFSDSGTIPEVISSFYIGVTRWFNFF
jgi:hypothetical protein